MKFKTGMAFLNRVFLALCSLCVGTLGANAQSISFPQELSVPGDSLAPTVEQPTLWINPYTNDVFGHTDKLNTHSFSVGYFGDASEILQGLTWSSRFQWRLITPIYKTSRRAATFEQPIGRYADWMDWRNSLLYHRDIFYVQLSLGVGHIGPKGGQEAQDRAHRFMGIKGSYPWDTPMHRRFLSRGAEGGLELQEKNLWGLLARFRLGSGYKWDPFTEEFYLKSRGTVRLTENLKFEGQAVVTKLLSSAFAQTLPYREEASIGLCLWGIWRPSVTVTTPYTKGDKTRQIHVSPADVTWIL